MQKPTKFLLYCASAAFALLGADHVRTTVAGTKVEDARMRCEEAGAEDVAAAVARDAVSQEKLKPWERDWSAKTGAEEAGAGHALQCDPYQLYQLVRTSPGAPTKLQASVIAAYEDTQASDFWRGSTALAYVLLFIGAVPFAWYFLLRRLRELGDAVRGK